MVPSLLNVRGLKAPNPKFGPLSEPSGISNSMREEWRLVQALGESRWEILPFCTFFRENILVVIFVV